MAHDVFVSYSAKDKPTADAVCATLERRGIRCWIAPRDILPGMDWGEAIIDGINTSRAIVLVFSANANESRQIKREVERAVAKGIPIIPFRIEDVPLSKSLEYLISTPHWLDALTPPMEQHAQYLAETINLLLNRHSAEVPLDSPSYAGRSYAPEPPKESSVWKWAVAGGAIAIVFILLLGFLIWKMMYYDGDRSSAVNESSDRPADISRGGISDSRVDQQLVGDWKTSVVIDRLPWQMSWKILETGQYQFNGTASDSGRFQGNHGRWNRRSTTGQRDYGTYAFFSPTSMSMTGLGGTSTLTRVGSPTYSSSSRSMDPQLLGSWKADLVANGVPLKIQFEVLSDDKYRTLIFNEDSGSIEANDGSWKQTSIKGPTAQGTYTFINSDAVSVTGPLGTAVWNRSR